MAQAKRAILDPPLSPPTGLSQSTSRSGGIVTSRSFVIGLLAVVLITFLSQKLDLWLYITYVTSGTAQTCILFGLAVLTLVIVRLGIRRLALTRKELLLIYLMMLVGGPMSTREGIGYLVCHPVIPYYYATQETRWSEVFHQYLPPWFGPGDNDSVRGFFEGGRSVPWGRWAVPILAWSVLYLALFGTTYCFNSMVEKQWIEGERLTFPLLYIPMEITRDVETRGGANVLGRSGFWVGASIPFVIGSLNALNRYFPSVPKIPLQYALLPEGTLSSPWSGLGTMDLTLSFQLIAVAFIVPADISFSCWFFHFLTRAENVMGTLRLGTPPDVYTSTFPAIYYQGSGAMIMLFLLLCWVARKQFRTIAASATFRWNAIGFLSGILFMAGWFLIAGMSTATTVAFLSMLLIFLMVFVRVRAETGLGTLLPPMFTNELMFLPFGTGVFNGRDLTLIQALRPVYRMMGPLWTVQGQLESFKIAHEAPISKGTVGCAIAAATVVGFVLAFVLALRVFYQYGFVVLPIGIPGRGYPGNQGYWSYGNLYRYLTEPEGPDHAGLLAMAAGAAICWITAFLRARFTWFPLHPVGFMSAHSWGMHLNWFPFLLGWMAKVGLVRYGGLSAYRGVLPFFVGLLVGSTLSSGVWGLVGWAVGKPMEVL